MHRRKIFLRLKRFCRFVINCILSRAYHTGKDYNSCGRKQNKAYFLNENFLLTNFSASNAWPFIITICCSTNYERLMQHNILNLACLLQCVHTLFLYITWGTSAPRPEKDRAQLRFKRTSRGTNPANFKIPGWRHGENFLTKKLRYNHV